ncbi:MAG: glycosyltransferase family 2 protein [Rhizomicrobium sp.]|nr:glycosyltransferase family 2 protein [Rhizomicrobium sp.]
MNTEQLEIVRRQFKSSGPAVVLAVFRNEFTRIPNWLKHYRSIGITEFIIIDNGSSDGTYQYLMDQPDVTALQTSESFLAANFGMEWINDVRRVLPPDTWTIYADADEYIVYSGWPNRSAADFIAAMGKNSNAVFGFMLDMYSRNGASTADAGTDLLKVCRYFDRSYRFRRMPLKPWEKRRDVLEVVGGPRLRLLSSVAKELKTNWIDYLIRGQLDRILKYVPARFRRKVIENYPAQMPALGKTPITKCGHGDYQNSHSLVEPPTPVYAEETVALLHFKFTSDLYNKIKVESQRGEHFRFGAEYILYDRVISKMGDIALYSDEHSAEFVTARDLEDAHLVGRFRTMLDSMAAP